MKKNIIFLILVLIFCACFSYAEAGDYADDAAASEAPAGMKIEKVGDLNLRLPKDAEVRRTGKGGLLDVETIDEYAARKLEEMESRVDSLEKSQEKLAEEIKRLKEVLNQLQNKRLISP